jgi:hypothetical protein
MGAIGSNSQRRAPTTPLGEGYKKGCHDSMQLRQTCARVLCKLLRDRTRSCPRRAIVPRTECCARLGRRT